MEHHVSEGVGPSGSGVVVLPPARNPSFFHILCFFLGCKFKGEALTARQRPAGPAAPSPHRRSLLIGEACAYIGCLGMRTVKVVPLSGMLST